MKGMIKSVEEIVNITESKTTPNKMAYRYLIKQVDKMLRSRALDQQYDAMFEVPAMVMFQPHFDRDFVATKLATHYRKRGFGCEKNEFTIILRWGKADTGDSEVSDDDSLSSCYSEDPRNISDADKDDDDDDDGSLPSPRKIIVGSTSLSKRVESMRDNCETKN